MKYLNVVLVPYWVKDLLAQQGRSLNIITNFKELVKCMSTDNLVTLLQAQEIKAGNFDNQSTGTHLVTLHSFWLDTCEDRDAVMTIYNEASRAINTDEWQQEVFTKLRINTNGNQSYASKDAPKVELVNDGNSVVFIVFNENVAVITNEEMYELIQNVLRIFYQYETPYNVANHPIFRIYLEMMRKIKMLSD